ncbi:hypothetical protein CsSME_00016170 [Camellia sinensis var. sinensis]
MIRPCFGLKYIIFVTSCTFLKICTSYTPKS